MAYTETEWREFVATELSPEKARFTVIELPVTKEALKKAIPGSHMFCTVANAFSMYTGMDANQYQIDVTGKNVKFVIDGWRYFLIPDVEAVEHIKKLDQLGFHENGKANIEDFEPFDIKLRAYEKKEVHLRPGVAKPKIVPVNTPVETGVKGEYNATQSKKGDTPKKGKQDKQQDETVIPLPAVIEATRQRRQRKDAGQSRKSRWSL
jgi:hypothetical protein